MKRLLVLISLMISPVCGQLTIRSNSAFARPEGTSSYRITYSGNVIATRAHLRCSADIMTSVLKKRPGSQKLFPQQVIARGVTMTLKGVTICADFLLMQPAHKYALASGSVVTHYTRDSHIITTRAPKALYNFDTNRITFGSSPDRHVVTHVRKRHAENSYSSTNRSAEDRCR